MTIIWCMVPEIWSATDRNFCHFGPFFALLPLTQNFLKNSKTCLEMALYTSVPKIMIICYTVPVIQHVTDVIFIFLFVLIFAFYHPNNPKNQIFEKWKKCCGIYHQFTHVYRKLRSHDVWFLRYGGWQMDRQTNRWTYRWTDGKSDIVGAQPKKINWTLFCS